MNSESLATAMHPIALAAEAMTGLAIEIRRFLGVSRVSTCSSMRAKARGVFMEWEVTANCGDELADTRTWLLSLSSDGAVWTVERSGRRPVEGGDEVIDEFDDVVLDDSQLAELLADVVAVLVSSALAWLREVTS